MEWQPHELALHDEVEGLRLVVRLGGCEEAVDDLGEAHASEVRGDGDGSGRRPQRRWQLRDEAHAHLARRVVFHRGDGGRRWSEEVVVPVGVGVAAAGRVGGASKGENILVKNNMMRDDAVGEEVKAAIPLMVRRVTEKKTASGAGR